MHAVFSQRVAVVAEYEVWARSPSTQIRLPSVVALRKYQRAPRRAAFTRFNVFLRDRFTCQYCGEAFASSALTFEHVIPRSRGGRTTWLNIVTACMPCNTGKGNSLRIKPRPCAQRADDERAAGCQARVPARLSARELGRLPLLGRAARGLTSSRSSVGPERRRPKAEVARSSRAETTNEGRLRWSGRHPVLKTGGHRKVWRSNRQPSANTGAGDRQVARTNPSEHAQILKRKRGLGVNQVPIVLRRFEVLLCAPLLFARSHAGGVLPARHTNAARKRP